eukprot:TRINITY_DN7750_c0_g1_i2.p1 TRINITY_DN7750_c0_g1~~TRINITY_DN7750_c0_g1_i2.p1  ORF type:complete len:507 (+),score=125.82 TRINITY_DN7750_c0_g1_i2:84-1604(+)
MYQYPVHPQPRVLVSRDYYDGGGQDYWYVRASEEEQMKKTVYEATSKKRTEPDWELNMSVVDQINNNTFGHEDAKKFISARLGNKEPQVVLLTLTLLETCMNNCGSKLHKVIGTKGFLGGLLKHAHKKIKYFEQKKREEADKEKGKPVKPQKESSSKKEDPKQIHKQQLKTEIENKVLKLLHAWNEIKVIDQWNWHVPVYYEYIFIKLQEKGVEFPPIEEADRPPTKSLLQRKRDQQLKERQAKRPQVRLPNLSTTTSSRISKEQIEKLASNSELLVDCIQQGENDMEIISNALVQELVPLLESGRKAVEACISSGNIRDETELGSMLSICDSVSRALDLYHIVESRLQVSEDYDDRRTQKSQMHYAAPSAIPFDPSTSASIMSMNQRLQTLNDSDEEEEMFLFLDENDEERLRLKEMFERRKQQKKEEEEILKWLDQSGAESEAFPAISKSDKSVDAKDKVKKKKKKKNGLLKKFIGAGEASDSDDDDEDDEDDAPLDNKRKGKK